MIVVGSAGPRSSLLGSVSADVSRRAPCPVVVVPPGADARVGGHPHTRDQHDIADRIARLRRDRMEGAVRLESLHLRG
jgi:universal stress protein family protein